MSTNILVPLDGSALAEHALPTAISLLKQTAGRLELAIVHETTEYDGLRDAPWNAMTESMRERYVTDKAKQLSQSCDAPVGHALLRGDAAEEIARRARAVGANVIVMSTHGYTGLTRALNGSVADSVIRESGVPVLVVRQPEPGWPTRTPSISFDKVLVLADGSDESGQIIEAAAAIAKRGTTRFLMLHVVPPIHPAVGALPFSYVPGPVDDGATDALVADARSMLANLATELSARSGCSVDPHVIVAEHVGPGIVAFATRHNVDLIAMTTHGRGASRLLFGSITDAVLRAAPLPMLVLRPTLRRRGREGSRARVGVALTWTSTPPDFARSRRRRYSR
ncbi:MAG TPA: universal stress protein [Gemmatimonadaceae bacterium]